MNTVLCATQSNGSLDRTATTLTMKLAQSGRSLWERVGVRVRSQRTRAAAQDRRLRSHATKCFAANGKRPIRVSDSSTAGETSWPTDSTLPS